MEIVLEVVNLILTLATLGVCVAILVRLEKLARRRKYALKRRAVGPVEIEGGAV